VLHQEIRYRILFTLYLKHYSDQLGHPQVTERVIEEAGLQYVEKTMVFGDIVYLKEGNLIKGMDILGQAYPYTLSITSKGIDKVETMIDKFVQFLKTSEPEKYSQLEAMGFSSGLTTPILLQIKEFIEKCKQGFKEFVSTLQT
jgi:hypothetical protein